MPHARPQLLEAAEAAADYRILPDASVLKIGGQSIIDRGRAAVYPLIDIGKLIEAGVRPPSLRLVNHKLMASPKGPYRRFAL